MAVESILTNYGAQQPLAEVSLEFDLRDPPGLKPELRTRLWNPDSDPPVRERLIGTAHDHGIPVTLVRDLRGFPQNLTPVPATRRPEQSRAELASVFEGISEQLALQSGRKPSSVGLRGPAAFTNQ